VCVDAPANLLAHAPTRAIAGHRIVAGAGRGHGFTKIVSLPVEVRRDRQTIWNRIASVIQIDSRFGLPPQAPFA
jgi:hypothetical protein